MTIGEIEQVSHELSRKYGPRGVARTIDQQQAGARSYQSFQLRYLWQPFVLRVKRIGYYTGSTRCHLHTILRPAGVRDEHLITWTNRCDQCCKNGSGATHSDGNLLWFNRVAIDALDFRRDQFAQPEPAGCRAIGQRFVFNGLDGGQANMLRYAKARLTDVEVGRGRQYFATSLG